MPTDQFLQNFLKMGEDYPIPKFIAEQTRSRSLKQEKLKAITNNQQ